MGQQQLLLLVLCIVVVGLAMLGAFGAFDKGARQDAADGLLDRALAVATDATKWKITQDPYSGGNMSYEGLADNAFRTLAMDSVTTRGRFAITGATRETLEITGVSVAYPEIGVRVYVANYSIDSSDVSFDGDISL